MMARPDHIIAQANSQVTAATLAIARATLAIARATLAIARATLAISILLFAVGAAWPQTVSQPPVLGVSDPAHRLHPSRFCPRRTGPRHQRRRAKKIRA